MSRSSKISFKGRYSELNSRQAVENGYDLLEYLRQNILGSFF